MNQSAPAPDLSDITGRFEQLLGIGVALSRERDINKLLEITQPLLNGTPSSDSGTAA